jgi:hypothetical protein
MMSNSSFTVHGLHLSKYSPHEPKCSALIVATMIVKSATFGALARILIMRCMYSCSVSFSPCLQLLKSQDVNSSVFSPRKLVNNFDHIWLHEYMCPIGMLAYQCCVGPFITMTKAFALMAEPPPFDSTAASYLGRNSLGSGSPSYYGRETTLNLAGHDTFSSSSVSGDEGSSRCLNLRW